MNDQAIEQEIQAKGLTAPRITPQDIEANIVSEHYFTARDGRRGAVADGTYVGRERPQFGEAGFGRARPADFLRPRPAQRLHCDRRIACASPENFDAELGRKIARQNAVQKIWPLMGYALKEQLAAEARGDINHDIGWAVRQANRSAGHPTRLEWRGAVGGVLRRGREPASGQIPGAGEPGLRRGERRLSQRVPGHDLKNAQGASRHGWVPSTTDLLMQDWEVVP